MISSAPRLTVCSLARSVDPCTTQLVPCHLCYLAGCQYLFELGHQRPSSCWTPPEAFQDIKRHTWPVLLHTLVVRSFGLGFLSGVFVPDWGALRVRFHIPLRRRNVSGSPYVVELAVLFCKWSAIGPSFASDVRTLHLLAGHWKLEELRRNRLLVTTLLRHGGRVCWRVGPRDCLNSRYNFVWTFDVDRVGLCLLWIL
jgi:hypothetical protein